MRMFFAVLLISYPLLAKQDVDQRLDDAATVFSEIMATPDKGIPEDLLEKAHCIVIVPGLKKGLHRRGKVRQGLYLVSAARRRGLVRASRHPG